MSSKQISSDYVCQVTRRGFVRGLVATASAPLLSSSVLSACQGRKPQVQHRQMSNTFDQALDLIYSTGSDHRGSTHVPMVAEALVTMGRADAVIPWVDQHRLSRGDGKSPEDFKHVRDVTQQNWRESLGEASRRADWVDFFEGQISEVGWETALGDWVPRLTPGLAAFAAHGLIRTAHAARSLDIVESPQRKRELAEGLGLWAATYQALPASVAKERGRLKPSEAVRSVEAMPPDRVRRGNIVTALTSLDDFPSFANAINLVDTSGDASQFLSDLTETSAAIYLANARNGNLIALVHALTGASALRLLLPHVKTETRAELLRYGWQLAAGIYAVGGGALPGGLGEPALPDKEDLIDRAVRNGNAHPIKFTEACIREYALNRKPVYLVAARHATENLRG
jgi:Questin oxidase-like